MMHTLFKNLFMGRLFIEYFDNDEYLFSCKNCKIHFAHTDNIVIRLIETTKGECIGFIDSLNLKQVRNNNWSTYTSHDGFDMFDDDSILKGDARCYYLYCIQCNNFIGWKYVEDNYEKHILLKSCIV